MRIGVFDSGVGGKSVADAIEKALPMHEVIFVNDTQNVPYGTKTVERLHALVLPILEDLATQSDVIVVACNTVSTTLIARLRKVIAVPMIALEPMIKPAVEKTKSKIIAVCATPATLASARYRWLKTTYAKDITVLEPDCSNWSLMIETDSLDHQQVHERIDAVCDAGADVVVLGCTHYHWIEDIVRKQAAGRAEVIQPEQAVVAQLKRVLESLD